MSDVFTSSPSDPLGYYAALGVGPLADAAEIKAAYRQRAKILHPDYNLSDHAAEEFQRLVTAHQVLRDSRKRRDYDATAKVPAPSGLIDPDDPNPTPLHCCRCGKITAQPRYVIFHKVKSFLLRSHRSVIRGIFCRDCADRTVLWASTITWLAGWWSLTGPYHTVIALWRNLRGGHMPRPDNLWVLLHQARAFLARGDNQIAHALTVQALRFAKNDDDKMRISRLASSAGDNHRKMKNRWRRWDRVTLAQAMPLLALLCGLVVLSTTIFFRMQTDSVTASITVHPAQAGETRHVAVEVLKVRQGPSATQPVVALLDHFATVQVMDSVGDGEWARILTPAGVTGYVPSRFLFGGSGSQPKTRWCIENKGEPPENGDILLRRTSGDHELGVINATGEDVVVRLKTPNGKTLLAFFIDADTDAKITGIPDGTFRAVFATGKDYSRACGMFLENMRSFIVPTAQVFHTSPKANAKLALSLTIPPIGDAPGQSHPLPLESFLDN